MKPLSWISAQRQRAWIRGLRNRIQHFEEIQSSGSMTSEQRTEQLDLAFIEHDRKAKHEHRRAMIESVTNWDRDVEAVWSRAERDTFLSLQREAEQAQEIQRRLQQSIQSIHTRFHSDTENLSRAYDENKTKPVKLFEQIREDFRVRLQSVVDARQKIQLALANRSLSVPVQNAQPQEPIGIASIALGRSVLDDCRQNIQSIEKKMLSLAAWRIGPGIGFLISTLNGVTIAIGAHFLVPLAWQWCIFVCLVATGLTWLVLAIVLRSILKRQISQIYPEVEQFVGKSQTAVATCLKFAEEHCRAEQQRLFQDFKNRQAELESNYRGDLEKTKRQALEAIDRIHSDHKQLRRQYAADHTQGLIRTTSQWRPQIESLRRAQERQRLELAAEHASAVEQLKLDFRNSLKFAENKTRNGIAHFRERAKQLRDTVRDVFPSWSSDCWDRGLPQKDNSLAIIPIGTITDTIRMPELLAESNSGSPLKEVVPIGFRLIEDGYLVLNSDASSLADAHLCLRNALLRCLTGLPATGTQLTIFDPIELGREFAWLMQLADTDPRWVSYRVWTQTSHITEQLSRLVHHTEDVIQQFLRDRYRDIREYNRDAGSLAEPFRLLVWSRFPAGLDDHSWRALCSLLSSGGRCGVCVLLLVDSMLEWPTFADRKQLDHGGLCIEFRSDLGRSTGRLLVDELESFEFHSESPPDEAQQQSIIQMLADAYLRGGRVEVPLESILPASSAVQQASTGDGLSIPIGQAGIGRAQSLRLGTGTSQHVLIAGKTGSGKSSLLHTLITSAATKYGPDQLRMVLLDFKKGVEFQVYAEHHLPHADIIGIESQREFGLSALEYLDRVMQKRGEMFREAGVQDVPSWRRKRPDRSMPRILIIVDEFQELFVEDDKLAQQAAMLLDRIVRQGRSFGMHVVLASQTLGGSYSLPRTTLAQMAVRIALQCEGSDAMLILSEDNLAAERLRHAGQAVYNDASGRVEGNVPFQVAYVSQQAQVERFAMLPQSAPFTDESVISLGRQVVFDGHKPAVWNDRSCEQALSQLESRDPTVIDGILGDSLSIEPAVSLRLTRQSGRNVLMVGTEDRNAADVLKVWLASANWNALRLGRHAPALYMIDGSRADDRYANQIRSFVSNLSPSARTGEPRDATSIIAEVHEVMQQRSESGAESSTPIGLVLWQLSRIRDLRRSEEFGWGGESDNAPKADAQLQQILSDGPRVGIHTFVWIDNWTSIGRWLARGSMHDLELRILMQMSANDSNNLIDAPVANRLNDHTLLLFDEAAGSIRKFRPYRIDDLPALARWSNARQS